MRHAPLLALPVMALTALAGADEPRAAPAPAPAAAPTPARKFDVLSPKDNGIIATGMNNRGAIIGFEWIEFKEQPGVVHQVPFYAEGKVMTYLPVLDGYTATFPAAVSDAGRVVGRASKPAPPGVRVPLRNQAFVWEAASGIRGLGALEGDEASFACGITRDGRRISGSSVGSNRVRPCIWDQDGAGLGWKGKLLPQVAPMASSLVVISDDGKYVASADGGVPCLWSEDATGAWTRETLGTPGSFVPRAVNNAGTVAGVRFTRDGLSHAILCERRQEPVQLQEPPGYVLSEASALNNAGVVVGMVDGPHGSKVGPNAFVYEAGRLRLLDEGGPDFTAATALNDQDQVAGVMEKGEEPPAPRKPEPPAGSK